ncbi:hypothetical protein GCM10010530_45780 [Kribbella aluminosa]
MVALGFAGRVGLDHPDNPDRANALPTATERRTEWPHTYCTTWATPRRPTRRTTAPTAPSTTPTWCLEIEGTSRPHFLQVAAAEGSIA